MLSSSFHNKPSPNCESSAVWAWLVFYLVSYSRNDIYKKIVMPKRNSSAGDEIDSEEAKRSPLSPDFDFTKVDQEIRG